MSGLASAVRVAALGGSLRSGSSSLAALRAAAAGAEVEVLEIAALDLPPYAPGAEPPHDARRLADAAARADAMVWSSPLYHGSVSGSFKNALDWLQPLADHAFDGDGNVVDAGVEEQLRGLGAEVVRAANQIRDTGTCDYADPEHHAPADMASRANRQ